MMYKTFVCFCFLLVSLSVKARAIYVTVRGVASVTIKMKEHQHDAYFIEKNVSVNHLVKFDISSIAQPCVIDLVYAYNVHSERVEKTQSLVVHDQDIFLSVNPSFIHHADSTIFQLDEINNNVLKHFKKEWQSRAKHLKVLHHFIYNYPHYDEPIFLMAANSYEHEVNDINLWMDTFSQQHKHTIVAPIIDLYRWHKVNYHCPVEKRWDRLLSSFMTNISWKDSSWPMFDDEIKYYLDSYVALVTKKLTEDNADISKEAVLIKMARSALDTVVKSNPKLISLMVDYFYAGFSQAHMMNGIATLGNYVMLDDYHGQFKEDIVRIYTQNNILKEGQMVPEIVFDNNLTLHHLTCNSKYKLLVFWSADCDHCVSTLNALHDWKQKSSLPLSVIAYSIDETETEVDHWKNLKEKFASFDFHFRGEAGINSKAAKSYGIIATPTMILIDANTNSISYLPKNIESLNDYLEKHKEH